MSLGGRIKLARKANEMSMRELAEKIGISAMAISKYERGLLNPSSEVLLRLAKALAVKVEYFFRPPPEMISLTLYRKHASLKKKGEDAINAQIQEWLERYLEIESFLLKKKRHFEFLESISIGDLEEIEEASNKIRAKWELGLDPIDNLIDTLENQNIKIHQQACDNQFDACTFIYQNSPVIAVNSSFTGDRQRFSIAHELGHIILKIENEELIEKAANRFAGAFLFPKDAALLELGKKRTSISLDELHLIKHKYGISMQAIIYRAKDLNIVSDNFYKLLFKEFSARGFRQHEPGEAYLAEKPKRMEKLLLRLLSEGIITQSRAEELFHGKLIELGGIAAM